MATAAKLISKRVVAGEITERLSDVADKLAATRASHCVVLDESGRRFVGIVRLAEVASRANAGNRILGDLVCQVSPLGVTADEPAEAIAALFANHDLGEAYVLSSEGNYVGLITAESVLKWSTSTVKASEQAANEARAQLASESQIRAAFLAALSHELRTPLSPILLVAAERAAEPNLPETVRADFQMIARSVLAEAQLIDDLIEVIQILSGTLPLRKESFSVHKLLEEVLVAADLTLRAKAIVLEKQLHASNDSACGDERRLRQAFENVLKNAINFSAHSGPVRIRTASLLDESVIKIEFQDSGASMSTEDLEKLFVPFSALNNIHGTTVEHRRMGFGISIARRLVELHGGRLKAESSTGDRGVTVTITLQQTELDAAS